ncbi:MAG TPA: hypothetical protein PKM88_06275, partial [bacterium]|nr:hypothetical protein [bacterium]
DAMYKASHTYANDGKWEASYHAGTDALEAFSGVYQNVLLKRNAADAARNVVVADLRHFSQYAIRVSTDTGAVGGEIVAYPNPWKSTYASRRIVFANVPTGVPVRLRIFTINGEKVADQELTLGVNQRLEWDLCNDSGKEVASGIYVYVLTCNGVEKISKLAIIR